MEEKAEKTPLSFRRPATVPKADWDLVLKYALPAGVNPYLIYSIGWHETHWGRLGAGRKGYHLGVGVYSPDNINERFKGLENQLKWAVNALAKHIKDEITLSKLIYFAQTVWKPENPTAWAKSVWKILQRWL